MRIGIVLAGVSYEDGSKYRYRNFEESVESFRYYVEEYLKDLGHTTDYYIYTYDTPKSPALLKEYNPIKWELINEETQIVSPSSTVMAHNIVSSMGMIVSEELDYVIQTRFDIRFNTQPFHNWDWNKVNFLWRENEFHHLPLVNDCFFGYPYSQLENLIRASITSQLQPVEGVKIGLHNLYRPLSEIIGEDNINICDSEWKRSAENNLYTLTRKA